MSSLSEGLLQKEGQEGQFFQEMALISQDNTGLLVAFIATPAGRRFASRVWQLIETEDEVSCNSAIAIRRKLEGQLVKALPEQEHGNLLAETLADALLKDIEIEADISSKTLVSRIISIWDGATWDAKLSLASQLVFSVEKWDLLLNTVFQKPIDKSIALVSKLGGAAYCISVPQDANVRVSTDLILFRMALYVLSLLEMKPEIFSLLLKEQQIRLQLYMQLTCEIAKDRLSSQGDTISPIFLDSDSGPDQLLGLIGKSFAFLRSTFESNNLSEVIPAVLTTPASIDELDNVNTLISLILAKTPGMDASAYYHGRVLSVFVAHLVDSSEITAKICDEFFITNNLRRSKGDLSHFSR